MVDPAKRDCPPHTKAKHQMMRRALDGWFPVRSSWNGPGCISGRLRRAEACRLPRSMVLATLRDAGITEKCARTQTIRTFTRQERDRRP